MLLHVETKLLDGVHLLRYKALAADAYCDENGLPQINPVMLVIARSIEEAVEFQAVLDSNSFDGGLWIGKTLLVHSKLTGEVTAVLPSIGPARSGRTLLLQFAAGV